MPSDPEFTCQAGVYRLHWRDEYLDIRVDRVRTDRYGVYGELLIRTTMPGIQAHVHGPVQYNLTSTQARQTIVRHLNGAVQLDWSGILEQTCYRVVEAHRVGTPAIQVAEHEMVQSLGMRVAPLLQEKQPTVFFGEGDSLKSFFATFLSVLVQTGRVGAGLVPILGNALYLDYETDIDTFWDRVNMITAGLGVAIPDGLYYRAMVGSLVDEAPGVSKLVADNKIDLVVIDSAAPATVEPEKAEAVIPFFAALRKLETTSLVIAHMTKTAKGEYPFGCYSADTEVLTSEGWKLHVDVDISKPVACYDLVTGNVIWEPPIVAHEYHYSGPMCRINGGSKASMDSLVTPNHRMVVKPAYRLPTGTGKILKNPRDWHFKEVQQLNKQSVWKVPYAPNADHSNVGGPTAFARFLGWWISEGCLDGWAPVLTQAEGRLAERMREAVSAMGYEANHWQGRSRPHEQLCMQLRLRKATRLGRWLADNCGRGAYNKRIPNEAFTWGWLQRRALFDALMEGDGHQYAPARWTYATISPQLADDVQRLAITLGYAASIGRQPRAKLLHHDRYTVKIGQRKTLTIRGERNITTVPYEGKVYCLTVSTGAYITRRNGKMAIHGNSTYWRNLPRSNFLVKADRQGDDVAISVKHTKSNNGRRLQPLGFQFHFTEDEVTISTADAKDYPVLAHDLGPTERIRRMLADGQPRTATEITEELNELEDGKATSLPTVQVTLSRGLKDGKLVNLNGKWALKYEEA